MRRWLRAELGLADGSDPLLGLAWHGASVWARSFMGQSSSGMYYRMGLLSDNGARRRHGKGKGVPASAPALGSSTMLVAPTSSVDDLFFDVLDEEQADWLLQTKQPPAHPGDVSGAHDSDLLDLRLGLTGSIILSILDLLTSEGEQSVCTLLKHKQPLGFFVWTARRAYRPACLRRANRRRPIPRPS